MPGRELVLVRCGPDALSAIGYLAALAAGHAVVLLEAGADPGPVIERYDPRYVVEDRQVSERDAAPAELHPDLRVLLSTSGSTGSPKLVRLTARNVLSNAEAIAEYLGIDSGERAIGSLPIPYSYGMSVLHSHLYAGASIAFTPHSVIRPEFWEDVRRHEVTSFAGVPYAYAMLERIGMRDMDLPSLRCMTQAGGRLDPEVALRYAARTRFFVMYGQTEASPRIAYVPPERLAEKAGSIGIAIPGGRLRVDDGEIVYEGPNVMLGYAETRADLARGDDLGGVLATGDLGHADDDGFFYVTGRLKRIAKVYGQRVNLDEVEAAVDGPAGAVEGRDRIEVYAERGADARALAARFRLPPRAIRVHELERLPVRPSGKIDYAALDG
ncbi:AMP-binding protein [Capillimicrobium parvum]|uniref:2-succinylbenzoate--CoA ligase n=1 Tax=Capillimicrobium parvum TaxID=2884022 RepID=A0A9E6Y2H8_9ACTN|nr:AMP-binding protein [Capillimicrobium parvum]UGS38688.1 2-succinylbenzoate--CoA ligase [Capillimicrobium parvum]